jgi:7,8-dihydroneopterin aldolase/epimerase/oxygenase
MHQPVDTVFLRGLAIETTIGFFEWERHVKQTVVLDLEMPVDCARAAASDSVEDTTDYKAIAKRCIGFVGRGEFNLVETLAHKLAMTAARGVRHRRGSGCRSTSPARSAVRATWA